MEETKCYNTDCRHHGLSNGCKQGIGPVKCADWECTPTIDQLLREKRAFVKQYVLNRTLTKEYMGDGKDSVLAGANAFDAIMKLKESK